MDVVPQQNNNCFHKVKYHVSILVLMDVVPQQVFMRKCIISLFLRSIFRRRNGLKTTFKNMNFFIKVGIIAAIYPFLFYCKNLK